MAVAILVWDIGVKTSLLYNSLAIKWLSFVFRKFAVCLPVNARCFFPRLFAPAAGCTRVRCVRG